MADVSSPFSLGLVRKRIVKVAIPSIALLNPSVVRNRALNVSFLVQGLRTCLRFMNRRPIGNAEGRLAAARRGQRDWSWLGDDEISNDRDASCLGF